MGDSTGTPSSPVSKFDYALASETTHGANEIGQRKSLTTTGSAFGSSRDVAWGYNASGEVVSADSSITGLDRAYSYDAIGNRISSTDNNGTTNYNAGTDSNSAADPNQYFSIENPQSTITNPAYDRATAFRF